MPEVEPGQASPLGDVWEGVAEFNRAAALLEQYEYDKAAKGFEKVLAAFPDWTAARFNLGVAYLNMAGTESRKAPRREAAKQPSGPMDKARQAFEAVLRQDAKSLHARYCLGLYFQHLGQPAEALPYFQAVYQADRNDPHAAYRYAEALAGADRKAEAIPVLEQLVARDPGFMSGVYRLMQLYQQTGQGEKAAGLVDRFRQLEAVELAGGAYVVKPVYSLAGRYAMALGVENLPLSSTEPVVGPRILFSPEVQRLPCRLQSWNWSAAAVQVPGIAVGDLDGDGDLDLVLCPAGADGATSIWWNDGSGKFSAGPKLADRGVSPCLGDIDDDGDMDLWLGGAGADLLLANQGGGKFAKVAFAPAAETPWLSCCARLVDLDSDGDLDLVSLRLRSGSVPASAGATPAPSVLLSNNRDGSFTEVAATLGLAFADLPLAALVCDDFDNDLDLDLLLFPAAEKPIAWVNDRVGRYRILKAEATGLDADGAVGATSADPDKDGDRDLLVFRGNDLRLYRNRGQFRFELDQQFAAQHGRLGGTSGQFADLDNDGDLDLLIADAHRQDGTRGPVLLLNDWPRDRFLDAGQIDPGNLLGALKVPGNACCVVADFDGDGKCDVLLAPMNEQPLVVRNLTQGGHYLALDLLGTRQRDRKTRSNNSAIGARVEVKTGMVFQQQVVGIPSGATAMPPLRLHFGLGENSQVQWLRILWPDAALQAELERPADQLLKLTEDNRREVSCPHLFVWDGERFVFVSDFGGMGGLGYLLAPGVYAIPDPTEYVPLPELKPIGSEYVVKVLEPLEEVVFLDEIKLIAVDHPAGTEVYPNEMMAVRALPPAFEVFCFRELVEPVRAVDHRGVDVTEALRRIDRQYAGAVELDQRFMGYAKDHYVELDFGDRLQQFSREDRVIFCLQGWVEYAYSLTNFAASQAGLRLRAPSVHALRGGRWVELFAEVGYPAGLQHMMTLDMTGKLLPTDQKIRISSNMEVYWDRIFLARHLPEAKLALKEIAASKAELDRSGYPREYTPDGRQPNLLDYYNIDPSMPWKLMKGRYTRYGDVTELLEAADDCYVILGPGDGVTLRFPAAGFGPIRPGCRRSFILKTDSFCKDMDLYTACSDCVEPLPFHGMSGYPYPANEHYPDTPKTRDYLQRFNTRQVGSR
ncbi:MAG: FG-GAP-like repeat-containing protein [Thermoguttaceae bacterium]